jgi:hypothetical protein
MCPHPKSLGGIYEQEFPKGANIKPPKRGINLFGGLLDVYIALLLWQFITCRTAIGNCSIKLKISP